MSELNEINDGKFYTRIYDKQEERMIYLGDEIKNFPMRNDYIGTRCFMQLGNKFINQFHMLGITKAGGYLQQVVILNDDGIYGKRFIQMRSTHLTDKNKMVIYQSDILRTTPGSIITAELSDKTKNIYFRDDKDDVNYIYDDEISFVLRLSKIIGNIHENYELMEENK